jgi:6-pyruvoyltetrahydropterin/6-carboxytetrahydropterin synthase
MSNKVAVYRKEHFNSAHRLFNADWDDEMNRKVFGKCSNPHYHGHNYELIVKLIGDVNPKTGFVMDMKLLSDVIQEHIIERFDHKNLNEDCKEFAQLNPTAENIAVTIYNILAQYIDPSLKMTVRLYETERNFVQYPA